MSGLNDLRNVKARAALHGERWLGWVRYRGKLVPARSAPFTPAEQEAIARFVAEKGVTRVPSPWDMCR